MSNLVAPLVVDNKLRRKVVNITVHIKILLRLVLHQVSKFHLNLQIKDQKRVKDPIIQRRRARALEICKDREAEEAEPI